jgi:hypothetical protein
MPPEFIYQEGGLIEAAHLLPEGNRDPAHPERVDRPALAALSSLSRHQAKAPLTEVGIWRDAA